MSTEDALGKLILFIAAVLPFVASSLIDSGETTRATLEWVRDHDARAYVGTLIDLAAVPFGLAGVVVYWISTREANAGLALLAAVFLTLGFVGLAAQHGSQALAFSLAEDQSVDSAGLAKTIDADELPLLVEKIAAFGGWLVGLLLALGTLGGSTPSKVAALGLLSVPFTLQIPELDPAVPGVLLTGALVLMAIPIARTRLGG
jgi:hypothetical protein